MLKNRLTLEEWNALPETDRAHYSKGTDGKGEGYFLQTEENTGLKRSLGTERTEKERAVRLLKTLVPELTDDNRAEWEDLVATAAEATKELKDAGIDLDEWKAFKEAKEADKGKGGKSKADDLAEQLLESQKTVRELERQKVALEREKVKLEGKVGKITTENDRLVRETALGKALDTAGITDPQDRLVVTALLEKQGIVLREVGSAEEARKDAFVKVDGAEIPLEEHAKDFVSTDLGKRFVKAPDNSGVGDGPAATPKPTKEQFAALDPLAKLTSALGDGAPAGGK